MRPCGHYNDSDFHSGRNMDPGQQLGRNEICMTLNKITLVAMLRIESGRG